MSELEKVLPTLDDLQLVVMAQRGRNSELAKQEWRRRHGLEYPYRYRFVEDVFVNCEQEPA